MATELTRRERLTRIFRNEPYDRPALRLMHYRPEEKLLHPDYRPIYERALQISDVLYLLETDFNMLFGAKSKGQYECVQYPPDTPEWGNRVSTLHTPMGDICSTFRYSTFDGAGYIVKHYVNEPEDLKKILTLEYEDIPFDPSQYNKIENIVGDRGVTYLYIAHPILSLQELCGSELLAIMSVDNDCVSLIMEVLTVFAERIKRHVLDIYESGVTPLIGWAGPEVCIPPLMSLDSFEKFIFDIDKPLCDLIHERGGYIWVHSHGRMKNVIKRFVDMGVDVLNPIEPPPMGDITLKEVTDRYGNSIGLEGNVEISEVYMAEPEEVRTLIKDAVEGGAAGGRFILCQSAGYMEYPNPPKRFIDNMMLYLNYGYELIRHFTL